jgi:rhomboid protease GluP
VTTYAQKLRHILPTLIAIIFGTVLFVTVLRLVLDVQFKLVHFNEMVWEIWIPAVAPWIPITLWLRQRIRVLTFNYMEYRRKLAYQLVPALTIMMMLIISQTYITNATGNLTVLEHVEDITTKPLTRYYRINDINIHTEEQAVTAGFHASGRYGSTYLINLYFAIPMVQNKSAEVPKIWYGVKFHIELSNSKNEAEKEYAYNRFLQDCTWKMRGYNYTNIDHMLRVPVSEDRDKFVEAIRTRYTIYEDDIIVLQPVREKFENRNDYKLPWFFGSFAIGITIFMLMLIWPGYKGS